MTPGAVEISSPSGGASFHRSRPTQGSRGQKPQGAHPPAGEREAPITEEACIFSGLLSEKRSHTTTQAERGGQEWEMATIPVAGTLASLDKPPVWHPSPEAPDSGTVLYPAWALASAPSTLWLCIPCFSAAYMLPGLAGCLPEG